MHKWLSTAICLAVMAAQPAAAERLSDTVFGKLVGRWKISGTTLGFDVATHADVKMALGENFIQFHVREAGAGGVLIFCRREGPNKLVAHLLMESEFPAKGFDTTHDDRDEGWSTSGEGSINDNVVTLGFPVSGGSRWQMRLSYDRNTDQWRGVTTWAGLERLQRKGRAKEAMPSVADWTFERVK